MKQATLIGPALLCVIAICAHAACPPNGSNEVDRVSVGQADLRVTKRASRIVPMFMEWAIKGKSLPVEPRGEVTTLETPSEMDVDRYRFPETKWVKDTLRQVSAKVVYISWNADGEVARNRFQWKYDVKSGKMSSLSEEDCERITERWYAGTLNVVEQAAFTSKRIAKKTMHVSFQYGFVGAEAELRLQNRAFVILKMPAIGVF